MHEYNQQWLTRQQEILCNNAGFGGEFE